MCVPGASALKIMAARLPGVKADDLARRAPRTHRAMVGLVTCPLSSAPAPERSGERPDAGRDGRAPVSF
jgi:hypothetical protein